MPASKTTNNTNTMPADKKTTTKKTPAKAEVVIPAVAAPAPTPAVTPAPVAAPVAVETLSADVILASIHDQLKALSAEVTTRVRALVAQAADATKAVKRSSRDSKKRVRKDPSTMTAEEKAVWESRRANNAFLKLRPISDELASFMGLPAKSQRSQTDVTKFVSAYVKEHNCFDPNFKRRIVPDAKLSKLLRVKDGQEVTYLNLQSFLKVHFLKPTA